MIVGLRLQLLYMRKNQESIHQLQMCKMIGDFLQQFQQIGRYLDSIQFGDMIAIKQQDRLQLVI